MKRKMFKQKMEKQKQNREILMYVCVFMCRRVEVKGKGREAHLSRQFHCCCYCCCFLLFVLLSLLLMRTIYKVLCFHSLYVFPY